MKPSAEESGTFWVSDADQGLPPICSARVETTFHELGMDDLAPLQIAMTLPTPDSIRQRLQTGRRCFGLQHAGQIVSYGWVSRDMESVGELERDFHFQPDEVYVWDCGTIPGMRDNHCYTALLNAIVRHFHQERVPRVWIGASRQNAPSVRGIAHAGFRHIVDLSYQRLGRLKFLRFYPAPTASSAHLNAAYRILMNGEWRVGSFAFGLKHKHEVSL